MLSREEAKAFYNRFGARQDAQGFYEDRPLRDLIEQADFENAAGVFEFGCGTGRFAETLLAHHLHLNASYEGVDISPTMVELAQERLSAFSERASVQESDGGLRFQLSDGSVDRVVTTYVLDLLSESDIAEFLKEANRILTWNGSLCVVGLTTGTTIVSRVTSALWRLVHRINARWVGGCRPLRMRELLMPDDWEVLYHNVVVAFGIPSEVLITRPVKSRAQSGFATGVA